MWTHGTSRSLAILMYFSSTLRLQSQVSDDGKVPGRLRALQSPINYMSYNVLVLASKGHET